MNKILNKILFFLGLSLFYILLGILFTYPLINRLNSEIPNNMYENANHTYLWGDQLNILASFREHSSNLKNILTGKPLLNKEHCLTGDVYECNYSTYQIVEKIIFSPYWMHTTLNIFFSDILVYNLVIISSFATTGMSAYLLYAEYLKKSKLQPRLKILIAFFGSLFVTIAPIRIHHLLVGHRNGFLFFVPILVFLLFEKQIQGYQKPVYKVLSYITTIILLLFLNFSESFLALYSLIYLALRISFEILSKANLKDTLKHLTNNFLKYSNFVISCILIVLNKLLADHSNLSRSVIEDGRPLDVIADLSPSGTNFFMKNVFEHEHHIFLGLGIIIIIAFLFHLIFTKSKSKSTQIFYFLVTIIFLLITVGVHTPFYAFLYNYLPMFKFARTPARALFFAFILIGILATLLAKNIKKIRSMSLQYVIVVSFIFVSIISFYSFKPISTTRLPTDEIFQLRDFIENEYKDKECKILYLPYTQAGNFFGSLYEYSLSNTHCTSLNGYHPYPSLSIDELENSNLCNFNKLELTKPEIAQVLDTQEVDLVVVFNKFFEPSNLDGFALDCVEPANLERLDNLKDLIVLQTDHLSILQIN